LKYQQEDICLVMWRKKRSGWNISRVRCRLFRESCRWGGMDAQRELKVGLKTRWQWM
jgi:hypothetical protein